MVHFTMDKVRITSKKTMWISTLLFICLIPGSVVYVVDGIFTLFEGFCSVPYMLMF